MGEGSRSALIGTPPVLQFHL